MSNALADAVHWADLTADKLIRALDSKKGPHGVYTLASGITPSGMVHFGNFREVITVDLVARALREKGKNVRFIFSWDDFDTFRKVPLNMPNQDQLKEYLFRPIVDTPDPYGKDESYARHHQNNFERELALMGVELEPLYQAKKYRSGTYKAQIKKVLSMREDIATILNKWRSEPLPASWLPVLIYCERCHRDRIDSMSLVGSSTIKYHCELCQHQGEVDVDTYADFKLPWRLDWPMRWAFEGVDFEPGGKDHSSEGGSYTTAKELVTLFGAQSPMYLQYDFVSFKGMGGKMSSSKGNLVTVTDVLNVYEPEMIRWIFASYKSNTDFALSFDLDVIKNYEDFDRLERTYFGLEKVNEKKMAMAKRVYELSQLRSKEAAPSSLPFRPGFRHLCNVLQINELSLDKTAKYYEHELKTDLDRSLFTARAKRAAFWIENFAPDEFKFSLNKVAKENPSPFVTTLKAMLQEKWDSFQTEVELHEAIYALINEKQLNPTDVFTELYQRLINGDKGPKLAGFLRIIGKERTLALL